MTSAGFAVWTVFRRDPSAPSTPTDSAPIEALVSRWSDAGVVTRGFYDVSAFRADADILVWLHADTAEALQSAIRELRRTEMFSPLSLTWSAFGVHRDAEFNTSHVPGFLRGEHAREWLSVYPFVRSLDWYVLDEDDRKRMLAEHGRKGAAFRSVVANTVAAFALGDYEWILPMESDSLTDLVDMMRELRATDARRHVREEVPFFTGRRIEVADIAEVLS